MRNCPPTFHVAARGSTDNAVVNAFYCQRLSNNQQQIPAPGLVLKVPEVCDRGRPIVEFVASVVVDDAADEPHCFALLLAAVV